MRPSTILYAVVLLATPAFTLPLVLVTPVGGPASKNTVRPVGGPTSKNTVRPVGGPTSEDTVRPLSGLSGKEFSKHASETPDDSDPGKLGLNRIEMDLEMNP